MSTPPELYDPACWTRILAAAAWPPAQASIGVLSRTAFKARRGRLLSWRFPATGPQASTADWDGEAPADMAVLLVADEAVLHALRGEGLAVLPRLVRRGELHAYVLKTRDALEAAGLDEFVEDLGLAFPRH